MKSEQIREMLEAATPGPWTFDRTDDPWRGSIDGASGTDRSWGMLAKVVVRMEGDVGDLPEGIANARLIAAAPDLAAEVLRLRDELASGSFYKESDIDAMQDEIARLRGVAISTAASLAAAISLLERGGKAAKKAAPSDKMFDQMLTDYRKSLTAARAALGDING
jgi:hypothetical protein